MRVYLIFKNALFSIFLLLFTEQTPRLAPILQADLEVELEHLWIDRFLFAVL